MSNNEGAGSMAVGFVLAIGNQTWGWFNAILDINTFGHWGQAVVTGCFGSIGAFCTTRLLKYIEKKIKDKKNAKEN